MTTFDPHLTQSYLNVLKVEWLIWIIQSWIASKKLVVAFRCQVQINILEIHSLHPPEVL